MLEWFFVQDSTASVPLLVGSYVQVRIEGPIVENVVELPRAVVRDNDTVWIMDAADELQIRDLQVVSGRPTTVLARLELGPDEQIATSPLPIAIPGMPLQRRDAPGRAGVSPEVATSTESDP